MNEVMTKTIAKINNVDIIIIENGEKRVAIRPICEALGIDYPSQYTKLQNDPILSSTVVLSTTVGADKKGREMVTIPFKYVFGWLFRIDSRNVKEESREAVLKYQLMCYDALYRHFTIYAEFVEMKQKAIDDQLSICENARSGFKNARYILDDATTALNKLRKLTLEDYDADSRQLKLFTEEQLKGGKNE